MPEAPPQPWSQPRPGVEKGHVFEDRIASSILGNERRLWVYTPAGYSDARNQPYGLLILFDGWGSLVLLPTPMILDNLLAAGRVPPLVALFVDSLDQETRLKELMYHQPFNDFLVQELLPWVRGRYHVTSDPRWTALAGASAGGLAATFAALHHPESFGCVLSQSGAFALEPKGEAEPGWLARQFAERERLDLHFHLDAGLLEVHSLRQRGTGPTLLDANRRLRDVLRAKGYPVDYVEFAGGHDYISWRGTLAGGLQALLGTVRQEEMS
jgi:enterochelin esterase family protein